MDTQVISGFPGIGKTYVAESVGNVLDSDSSAYSWLSPGVRNPRFPDNYIAHIKENIGTALVIVVSSHKEVRDAMVAANIKFKLVYPENRLKSEYLSRYAQRGSP